MRKMLAVTAMMASALGGSALATEIVPVKAAPVYAALQLPAPPVAQAPWGWNGIYVGLNLGGAWDANGGQAGYSAFYDPAFAIGSTPVAGLPANVFFLPNGATTGAAGGVIGGGQVGYNFLFNPSFVIGGEADFQGVSLSGNGYNGVNVYPSIYAPGDVLAPVLALNGSQVSLPYFGSLRGRVGFVFAPALMAYGPMGPRASPMAA